MLVFVNAETRQPALQFASGLRFRFLTSKRWSPYADLGYGILSLRPYSITYEFRDPITNAELDLDKDINRSAFLPNYLILHTGLERKISKKLYGNLGFTYRQNFSADNLGSPDLIGVNLGVRF